jgi:hypothetical protein
MVVSMISSFKRSPVLAALGLTCLVLLANASVASAAPSATFRVLHDDHIGTLSLPAGNYTVTPYGGMTTTQAQQRLNRFLQDFDGRLPAPWQLDPATATFDADGAGFTVVPAPAASQPDTTSTGTVCPGVFVVEHDDRIGSLAFPRGSYQVTSLRGSCAGNMSAFRRLLAQPANQLPSTWSLAAPTGTFSTSAGSRFRVKPAAALAGRATR